MQAILPTNLTLNQYPHRISSARLLIRRPQPEDLADMFAVHRDDEVNRFLPYVTWQTPADGAGWFERAEVRFNDNSGLQMVIEDRASGRVIGGCVLFHFDLTSASAEIGYALGRDWWGQGYGTEAMQALIDYAFVVLGLRRLTAHVDTRNQASHQLLLKLGFTHEGVLREDSVMKGELTSGNVYGLLRREWEK